MVINSVEGSRQVQQQHKYSFSLSLSISVMISDFTRRLELLVKVMGAQMIQQLSSSNFLHDGGVVPDIGNRAIILQHIFVKGGLLQYRTHYHLTMLRRKLTILKDIFTMFTSSFSTLLIVLGLSLQNRRDFFDELIITFSISSALTGLKLLNGGKPASTKQSSTLDLPTPEYISKLAASFNWKILFWIFFP